MQNNRKLRRLSIINNKQINLIQPIYCPRSHFAFGGKQIIELTPSGFWELNKYYQIMCVNDYQFRHFTATRDKVCRKFIFVDEDEFARTYLVNISQFQEFGDVSLCKILIHLSTKGLNITNRKFYLPKYKAIIQPFTFCKIHFEGLDEKEIYLRCYYSTKAPQEIFAENELMEDQGQNQLKQEENYYCRFQEIDDVEQIYEMFNEASEPNKERQKSVQEDTFEELITRSEKMIDQNSDKCLEKTDESCKKAKETERGIYQVIRAVKLWRNLYESKRCNLTKAAKVVGISKKSLDDYYLVLRIGEILGFSYQSNLQKGMGDLRNFIRLQQQKVTGKLGKSVECFKLVQDFDLDLVLKQFIQK